jgi:hypothetical protein
MLINTEYFSESAKYKLKNGVYTAAPFGSKEYRDYWEEEDKRCLEGYSVGGTKITGQHYFFLNFKQLETVRDVKAVASTKDKTFPRFWEAHYKFFHALEEAELAGKHMCILKPRGSGFSEIMSSVGVYYYTLVRGSKCFYFASNEGYLNKDGVITKCWDHLEFLNAETHKAYRHLRQKKDQDLHKRASMVDPKTGNEYGYKSEIIGRVIDHPRKVRGARTGSRGKVFFEEGGSFPNLKDAVITTRPLVEQGGITTGQIILWGTGGEKGPGIEGLEHIFYHPDAYNMMSWENIWDEDRNDTKCCYFIPVYDTMDKYMDENGNALKDAARSSHEKERAKIHVQDPTAEDKYIAEFPFTPSEALIRLSDNIFPVVELQKQLLKVSTDRNIQGFLKNGWMYTDVTGKPKFRIDRNARPIVEFPHGAGDNLNGCVTIVESPYKDQLGRVPDGMYLIVVDPYYKDNSESKISLASAYIYKHYNNSSPTEDDIIVGWYTSRPEKLDDFYRQLFMLAEYYNATIQAEIAGGGKGILDYATFHKLKQYCEKEPDIVYNKENAVKAFNKPYFMNMAGDRPQLALAYLSDWLRQERSAIDDNGEVKSIMNLHKIYDEGLLKELIKFNASEGNFDRVSAMRLLPFMIKERSNQEYKIRQETSQKSYWDREFHSDGVAEDPSYQLTQWELMAAMNKESEEKYEVFTENTKGVKTSYSNNAVYPEDLE